MCPVLQQYEGGWATRDLMGQFLRNTTAYDRRREKAIKVLPISKLRVTLVNQLY